jgi:ferric-chelate reductase (NADPH)
MDSALADLADCPGSIYRSLIQGRAISMTTKEQDISLLTLPPLLKQPGLLESAMLKLFTRIAEVQEVQEIGPAYRLITLSGDVLRDIHWTPGDKIQIQLGGWKQRTYTPIDWDSKNGRTRILIYLHGDGPGTEWARALHKGKTCIVFGPRKSVRLAAPAAPVILFGDETTLGLAAALRRQSSVQMLFEVSSIADTMPALQQLHLDDAHVCERHDNDEHLSNMQEQLAGLLLAQPGADIVLTGKASSIQHMSRLLRQRKLAGGRRQTKAYWATGKSGLD